MLKKIDIRIPIIVVLLIIYIVLIIFYFKTDSSNIGKFSGFNGFQTNKISESSSKSTISTSSTVESSLVENVDLHYTYYLKKIYVTVGQKVSSGEKLIQYTDGTFLKAPYDCIITNINMPSTSKKITNDHYIQISSINSLKIQFKISESKLSNIQIGDEASIKISALDDLEYKGMVTDIDSVASNGKFTIIVSFNNDGKIMLGMSASITI